MGDQSSISVAGNLNIGVDASYAQSIPFSYKFLRIIRESNPGESLEINGLQVWQNNQNILSNPNHTNNEMVFYDSSAAAIQSTYNISNGILESLTINEIISNATYAWDFRESLTDFNGGQTITPVGATRTDASGLTFDGDDYATIPTTMQAGGSSTFVVEIYFTFINLVGTGTPRASIIDFYGSETDRFRFMINKSNSIYVRVENSDSDTIQDNMYDVDENTQYLSLIHI